MRLKFYQENVTVSQGIKNYEETRAKLIDTQENRLQSAAKNNNVTVVRITKKKIQDEELPHEYFLITTTKT